MNDDEARRGGSVGEAESPEIVGPDPEAAMAQTEDRLRRALADLDNLRKRYHRQLASERDAERRRAAMELVPIVDDLERALDHAEPGCPALVEGIRVVREQAVTALARLGFERFDDVGRAFDPGRDEAVSAIDNAAPAGTVVAAVRPGYGSGEELLRPAGVVVSKGSG
ncbi:MAG TPA: nucleotide exchange factor GrpE [Acidimicrobiia bacterium]|nr:nucleotide exchange factor GrpE [Acidimicrobiia bacterium]